MSQKGLPRRGCSYIKKDMRTPYEAFWKQKEKVRRNKEACSLFQIGISFKYLSENTLIMHYSHAQILNHSEKLLQAAQYMQI
jgi:hypothetical protein